MADQLALFKQAPSPSKKFSDLVSPRPQTTDEWLQASALGGNPEEGRRIFEHPNAGSCWRCHTVNGRGGRIGPDLSIIARTMDRRKLAESILRPSKEISPQYSAWTFVMRDGRTFVGLVVEEDREGRLVIGTTEGKLHAFEAADVEERHLQSTSIMPERLVDSLTIGEFRDLVAFLATLK